MSTSLKEMLGDLTIRLEKVIPLIGSVSYPSSDLEDLIEDGDNGEVLIEAGFTASQLKDMEYSEDRDTLISDFISEWETYGFLVMAYTPMPQGNVRIEDGRPIGGHMSWGWSAFKWFHVNSLEDLVAVLPDWHRSLWMKSAEKGGEA